MATRPSPHLESHACITTAGICMRSTATRPAENVPGCQGADPYTDAVNIVTATKTPVTMTNPMVANVSLRVTCRSASCAAIRSWCSSRRISCKMHVQAWMTASSNRVWSDRPGVIPACFPYGRHRWRSAASCSATLAAFRFPNAPCGVSGSGSATGWFGDSRQFRAASSRRCAPLRKLVLVRLPILRALLLPDSPSGTSLRACMVRNELGRFRPMLPRILRRNLRSPSASRLWPGSRSVRHASLVLSLKLPPRARRRARKCGRGRSARCDRALCRPT